MDAKVPGSTGSGLNEGAGAVGSTAARSTSSAKTAKKNTSRAHKPDFSDLDICDILQNGLELARGRFGSITFAQVDMADGGHSILILPPTLKVCIRCANVRPSSDIIDDKCSTCRNISQI